MTDEHSVENDAPNPARCSDLEWWEHVGMCGGCGSDDCHPGPCGDVETGWFDHRICDRCPHRAAQGFKTRITPPAVTEEEA